MKGEGKMMEGSGETTEFAQALVEVVSVQCSVVLRSLRLLLLQRSVEKREERIIISGIVREGNGGEWGR